MWYQNGHDDGMWNYEKCRKEEGSIIKKSDAILEVKYKKENFLLELNTLGILNKIVFLEGIELSIVKNWHILLKKIQMFRILLNSLYQI